MNKLAKYISICAAIAIIFFITWYFSSIVTSILISVILSIIGKLLVNIFSSIKIGRFQIPRSIAALLTLIIFASIIFMFFIFLAPLIGQILTEMGNIDLNSIADKLHEPLAKYNRSLHKIFPAMSKSVTIQSMIIDSLKNIFNFSLFSAAFNSIAAFVVHFLVQAFTVIFVTFFFLQDNDTFSKMVLAIVPQKFEDNTKRALDSVNNLLVRYFTGISLEAILITFLNTIGLTLICGLNFHVAVVLAFFSGVINVIPYIGPIFAGTLGTIIGVISLYGGVDAPDLGILVFKFIAVFFSVHMIDVFIFQPYIYSNSVKAHPLEIFLIILVAGNIGGIIGMLVAIPAYTVIRVFAKEFLSGLKIVQQITGRM